MRHPALTRMLGVFLAVVSVITLIAGGLGFGRAASDRREQRRGDELLESRIAQAEALRREMAERQAEYDDAASVFPGREAAHKSESSGYRMDLATYTATRAGLILGRKQLDETAAALDESMELFRTGLIMFLQGKEAFDQIYNVYLALRSTLDQGLAIYQEAASRLPEDSEGEISFTPEEVLALAELGHSGNEQLRGLLEQLRDGIPADQRQAGDFIRRALEEYQAVSPDLENFSVEQLAYGVSRELYDRASEAMDAELAEGVSPEEARAAADRICRESFGLSFDEVGQWLEENEPEGNGADSDEGGTLSPEMLDLLLEQMPDDRDLIDVALGLLADSDRDLSEKEAAFRADPHDMSAAELLVASYKEGLDASERLLGLVEPTILDAKQTVDSTHHQLALGQEAILDGQAAVKDGYRQLDQKAWELFRQLRSMKRSRRQLEAERGELDALEDVILDYEDRSDRFRTLRAQLLADDAIYERQKAGEDFLDASREELKLRVPAHDRAYALRRVMCALMIAGALCGLLSALGAFEKPRIRKLWLPLLAAAVLSAAAEAISLSLGRGLLYSALFVLIFALAMLPLGFEGGTNTKNG